MRRLRRRDRGVERELLEELATTAPLPAGDDLHAATPEDRQILERALPYTMTGVARLQATIDAVRYCVRRGVPGAFAECGVWLGGSVLAMLLTLQKEGAPPRDVYLYDTFEGMNEPTAHATPPDPPPAHDAWE